MTMTNTTTTIAARSAPVELQSVGKRYGSVVAVDSVSFIIEAGTLGCAREVLIIVSALSMQDPRERPADKQTQADQSHARFRDEHSDFISLLNLWAPRPA